MRTIEQVSRTPQSVQSVGVRAAARMLWAFLMLAAAAPADAAVDPPGFAPVTVKGTQVISLNVTCFEHGIGDVPPSPCRGDVMFHDAAGRELKAGSYALEPGETMSLRLAIPAVNAAGLPITRVTIIPCIVPGEGLAIPSVEVFDREAGRAVLFAHPAAARMSAFSGGQRAAETYGAAAGGDEVAFDPQPDPPVFGMATLRGDQVMRVNVTCFNHDVNGFPPNPCTGTVMFHDAAGKELRRAEYALEPGQTRGAARSTGAAFLLRSAKSALASRTGCARTIRCSRCAPPPERSCGASVPAVPSWRAPPSWTGLSTGAPGTRARVASGTTSSARCTSAAADTRGGGRLPLACDQDARAFRIR